MLGDVRFLRVFAVAVATHMLWNAPFELPLRLKEVGLGFVAWVTALSLLQAGLRQVKGAQARILPATTIIR
jgi:RsiW-degrading membrane proteinase PrsW (M82 family)